MQIHISSQRVSLTPSVRTRIAQQITGALERFAAGIHEIRVELRDRNGRRGGCDKQVRIRVALAGGAAPVQIDEERASTRLALRHAAGKVAAAVRRALARKRG